MVLMSDKPDWFAGLPYDQQGFAGQQPGIDPSFSAIQRLARECDELRAENERWREVVKTFSAGNVALEAENERLREALELLATDERGNAWVRLHARAALGDAKDGYV